MAESLASALFGACSAWRDRAGDAAEVEAMLADTLARARAKFPGIGLADGEYIRHIATRLDVSKALGEALATLHTADLYLACACARGDRRAILLFEEHCVRPATAALAQRGIPPDVTEEVKQDIRERMLVGDGSPKILLYDGTGGIRQWLRVSLVRDAVHMSKRRRRDQPLTFDLIAAPAAEDSPEVTYFKKRYRADYKTAFELAIRELDARQRALLRQHYILGMTVDEIGSVYEVHRATAGRWVTAAREDLMAKARRQLAAQLRVPRAEVEAIVQMIESQLDVSLQRLLVASTRSSASGGARG
jgi:RNA polymerase sigma-70 factor (ECF subfamily)